MYKIGVIGDKQSVLGFKAFGLNVFECSTPEEAKSVIREIAHDDYAIIYVIEKLYKDITDVADEYNSIRIPSIVPIPGQDGSYGVGIYRIKKAVEKAVGADVLSDN